MAIMWSGSLVPWIDPNGDPYSGAKAYFFDVGTLTPMVVYTDAALSIPHDHPATANAGGMFPAIFIPELAEYRLRVTNAADVTLHDVDGIATPTTIVPEFPSGDTEAQYLYQTGDIKMAWRSSAPAGYVRLNGRSIGSAASAASERANNDCEDLFIHLWNQDANLAVSGGRGVTAAGDWAAAKTIALPDFRGRVPFGLDGMGNAASGRVTDEALGADSDALGSAGGAATHILTQGQMPAHSHGGSTASAGAHQHFSFNNDAINDFPTLTASNYPIRSVSAGSNNNYIASGNDTVATVGLTSAAGAHGHAITPAGSGEAHNNLQPSVAVPFFIKL